MMADSSELGMAFGSAGATTVFMCVATTCRFRVLREKAVELLLQRARRRLAGWQLVQHDFKYFCLHGNGSINNARQPRLTPRTGVGSRDGMFMIIHHENALELFRPASDWRSGGLS